MSSLPRIFRGPEPSLPAAGVQWGWAAIRREQPTYEHVQVFAMPVMQVHRLTLHVIICNAP